MSDRGLVRRRNEDAFIADQDLGLFAVIDGMGGHVGGDVASRAVADAVVEFIRSSTKEPSEAWPFSIDPSLTNAANRLQVAIRCANRVLFELVNQEALATGAGATISAVLIEDGQLIVSNVGDCRVYLARQNRLSQLTQDHSVVAEQLRRGLLSPDEAATHPMRHVVTRSVSGRDDLAVDTRELRVEPADRVLLCSDGVHALVDGDELATIVCQPTDDLRAICQRVVEMAKAHGGTDNATAVLIAVNGDRARGDSA